MRIDAVVREVSPDDESNYAVGPKGERRFMGHPLSDYLPRMLKNDGFIDVPLPPGPLAPSGTRATTASPELHLSGPKVEDGVSLQAVAANTVRISLRKFLHRDPETTFLHIAFEFHPSDEAEAELVRSNLLDGPVGFE